jgi:hypothetical protein
MTLEEKALLMAKYLYENYYDDREKLSKISIICSMLNIASIYEIPSLIDKVAIINGIKKSCHLYKEIIINA